MNMHYAIDLTEGIEMGSEEEILAAWQYLIDTGICWKLQGSFGRTAMHLIECGVCRPAGREHDKG